VPALTEELESESWTGAGMEGEISTEKMVPQPSLQLAELPPLPAVPYRSPLFPWTRPGPPRIPSDWVPKVWMTVNFLAGVI
jgi:hypothetical protein